MILCYVCRRPKKIVGRYRGEPICGDCNGNYPMTEQANVKKKILDHMIMEKAQGAETVSLRDFADENGWEQKTVAGKVDQMYPALNSGISPMVPWLWERKAVDDMYDRWDAEPPEEIEKCNFVDDE